MGIDLTDLEEKRHLSAWLDEHARRCREEPECWTQEKAMEGLRQFQNLFDLERALMAFDFQI